MFRTRWFRALALLVLLAGTTYVLASLFVPSPRRVMFGVDKKSGRVRVVGANVTFLPSHQYYRISFARREGWAQRDGLVRVESQDGVPVTISYRLRFGIAGHRLPDASTLVHKGWSAWIGPRLAEAVNAVTRRVTIEELLAPNSGFNSDRGPLRRMVAARLAGSGLEVAAFEIAGIEPDRQGLAGVRSLETWHEPADANRPPRTMAAEAGWGLGQAQKAQLPPRFWGRYAYYNNFGVDLCGQRKHKEAVDAFARASELNPGAPVPHLNLAMALLELRQHGAADGEFLKAVAAGLPGAERRFVDFAAFYRERNMAGRAVALLRAGREIFPQSGLIAANLGSALLSASRSDEGVPELERALALQPASTTALNSLGAWYAKEHEYARALDFWRRSLAIDPRQPRIRAGAAAARARM